MVTEWSFYVVFVFAVDFAADLICHFNQAKYILFKIKRAK